LTRGGEASLTPMPIILVMRLKYQPNTEKAPHGAFSLLAIQRIIAKSSYINKLRQSEYVLARNPIYIGLLK
jgi:hypothetical protein